MQQSPEPANDFFITEGAYEYMQSSPGRHGFFITEGAYEYMQSSPGPAVKIGRRVHLTRRSRVACQVPPQLHLVHVFRLLVACQAPPQHTWIQAFTQRDDII